MTVEQGYALAVQMQHAGRLGEAEGLCRQILAADPRHLPSIQLLAFLSFRAGRSDEAIALLKQAIAIDPSQIDSYINLGVIHSSLRQFDAAISAYQQAIALRPDIAPLHFNLANALKQQNQFDAAITEYRAAIKLQPDFVQAQANLGNTLRELGRLDEAMTVVKHLCESQPALPNVHNDLGNVLREMKQIDAAIASYERALSLDPNYADATCNLANALKSKGESERAIEAYRRALKLNPSDADTHLNLGSALMDAGQFDEAIVEFRHAISLRPNFSEAYLNLGTALHGTGRIDDALSACRQAIALAPSAPALANLAKLMTETGDVEQAIGLLKQAVSVKDDPVISGNLLYTLHLSIDDPQRILGAHRDWAHRHADPLTPSQPTYPNAPDPDRRLRIGYVSSDFRNHSVGRFMLPLLANHDREQVEIFCYSGLTTPDAMTDRLRCFGDTWRTTVGIPDDELSRLIRDDGIDILVDLALFTAGTRITAFASKPAPVQVTYLAYCSTSGMAAMDYRFTDPYLDPSDAERDALYSESSYRLPRTYWCYSAPPEAPEIGPPPAETNGFITFGCLNNFAKVTRAMMECWGKLLLAVNDSRLLLHSFEGSHRDRVRKQLEQLGVSPSRIDFVARLPMNEYFEQYNKIDIALDTFPFAGGTTTCDALWMAAPVVSRAGQTAVSRAGLSILSNLGMPEWVADAPEQYISIASGFARDIPRLSELRQTLRQRMLGSPLMDAASFARDVESAFRQMWRQWCARHDAKGSE